MLLRSVGPICDLFLEVLEFRGRSLEGRLGNEMSLNFRLSQLNYSGIFPISL